MNTNTIIRSTLVLVCAAGLLALPGRTPAQENGGDHSEAEACAGCHAPGNPMLTVVMQWETSEHGNSYDGGVGANTSCASCKSPLLAVPDVTETIPQIEWQDVTCGACHPPHDLRVLWETPIGSYDVETGDYTPIYDSNELCVHCHTGSRHARDFKGFGQAMYDKHNVKCNDCHMPKVPVEVFGGLIRDTHSHTWRVAENLPYSCGVEGTGCHANHSLKWAEKQIGKMKIHGSGGNPDNWPYYPGGESPP